MMKRPNIARGFTLVEIMVALTIGGIVLGSLYAVGSASTRHFRQQERISTTQTSLRNAMAQVKRDFQRAGFLASRSASVAGQLCGTLADARLDNGSGNAGTGRLAAISTFRKNVARPSNLDQEDLNAWATVDHVVLMGDYATSGEYSGITLAANRLTVSIPVNWESFQRDFTDWYGANVGNCNATAFADAFAVGRMVRLHTLSERYYFSRVASVNCPTNGSPATVVLTDAVPTGCNVTGGWIAPVSTIRYKADDASAAEGTRFGANRSAILRRTEVDPIAKDSPLTRAVGTGGVNVDDRSILEYLVRFNVDFMLADVGTNQISFVAGTAADVRSNPERVRGVIIDLAARTAEQEANFTSGVPGLSFRVTSVMPGAARVRQMHAELLLPNTAP